MSGTRVINQIHISYYVTLLQLLVFYVLLHQLLLAAFRILSCSM